MTQATKSVNQASVKFYAPEEILFLREKLSLSEGIESYC